VCNGRCKLQLSMQREVQHWHWRLIEGVPFWIWQNIIFEPCVQSLLMLSWLKFIWFLYANDNPYLNHLGDLRHIYSKLDMLKFHVPFSTWSYFMTSKMNKRFTRIIWGTTWQLEKWVLASKPRKRACCAKSYTKFNMRIMHKLGCYMISQIPLSKNSSCHYFQSPH
jgi:hypothetical protein